MLNICFRFAVSLFLVAQIANPSSFAFAQRAVPKALSEWQAANIVWQQANIGFQNAGVDYDEARLKYLRTVAANPNQETLAMAVADWQQANQVWLRANVYYQETGKAFLAAGTAFIEKSVPIYNAEGRYVITQPSTIPVVVVNNGSVVHIKDLPEPFNKLVPSGQGPGNFAYNWSYAEKIYGYAYLVIDETGSGQAIFEFTTGADNDDPTFTSVALTALDSQGNRLAVFGITSYTHTKGDTQAYYKVADDLQIPIGGDPNHGHAHAVSVGEPVEWWNNVHTLVFEWTETKPSDAATAWLADKTTGLPESKIYIAK